ncbi:hypothetical protein [Leptospira borgpetersenii]|uniref:Chain length determinant protein n=2 Tax=Leptospira borgpetersenii serovar Hardjo-bovis TaxID=338217 RepID=Q04TL1_LEPBJ|nr:hypothetical protein [Leptospira borgpetersenii]ABJ75759.1 Hypothetical protein LBJ_1149 [Leptospira borgpetersenii serovar Hardjo-bovis str. JB197]ABJ78704.1 Hypothetical protein LBL_1203 [Leptospira borgpetersenii serovar Hardjo-bovis str. L550]AMX59064.1 hypothetical protein LBK6_12175 [Leptospira borgpetersenii serovar Hardjo]AMX61223.1 hypothetical protein LBK9_06360 [Leptospira borgpetersenii serovar Hardjo]AMX64467.1 hypothetical protein LBK30_06405 [Leptospira borgpetersenii serovar
MKEEDFKQEVGITVLDFVVLIIRRKILFLSAFIFIFVIACFYALRQKNHDSTKINFEYKSIFSLGVIGKNEFGMVQYVETPQTVLEKLNSIHIPQMYEARSKAGQKSVSVSVSQPSNTNLIILTSNGGSEDEPEVQKIHKEILENLYQLHRAQVNHVYLLNGIRSLGNIPASQIDAIAIKSPLPVPVAKNPVIIVGAGIVFGLIAGCFFVICFEFFLSVRRKLKEPR